MIAFAKDESPIVDANGKHFKRPSKARQELAIAFEKINHNLSRNRSVQASYDAAQTTTEFGEYWAPADNYDADSANRREVRQTLVKRSRYEVDNNGYSDGIAQTYANDAIASGPTLRMRTGSERYNRLVERTWASWSKRVGLRRKLWTMAHAKHMDGEAFGVIRPNPGVRSGIPLDLTLHETEMCQTPNLPYGVPGYIDGIRFDAFGNPTHYDFLKTHPGSNNYVANLTDVEVLPADYVCHWFKMRRPGQHRGVPEMKSTLNIGAAARRWREATIAAAENIANFSLFLRTMFEPEVLDEVSPMSTMDIHKRLITALPQGWDAFQPRAEQPVATHAEFNKSLIGEQARPRNMPLNKAACDSHDYNYASGRLDHATYYVSIDLDRDDCEDLVLDVLFEQWYFWAVAELGWLGGDPFMLTESASAHEWDWPKHHHADVQTEASATKTNLETGARTYADVLSEGGKDPQDVMQKEAETHGLTVEQMQIVSLIRNLPQHVIPYVVALIERGEMMPEVNNATAA